jgi:polyhydroxyalkanoate synthase subunit PhaC
VLSTSGHIQALVNPPHPKSRSTFRVGETSDTPDDPTVWAEAAKLENGSWWGDHAQWLTARSGERVPAPEELGSDEHPPIGAAPGVYVLQD